MELKKLGFKEEFETVTNEFKRFLNEDGKALEWLKTVAAFSNTEGGTLYVGVEDQGYEPIGLDKKSVDRQVQLFSRLVKEHIRPEPLYKVAYLPLGEDRYAIEFSIALAPSRPVVLSYGGNGSIFVRKEGSNRLATTEEIQRMALSCVYTEYDEGYSSQTFRAEDFTRMYETYERLLGKKLTEKELYSVGFFDANKTLRRASLLFSDHYEGEETALAITNFIGLGKGGDVFLAEPLFKGNILDGIALVQERFRKNSKSVYVKTGKGGKDFLSYPEKAVTEAIVNAYAHKNYLLAGDQIEVNFYLDRAEIVSPGSAVARSAFHKKKDLSSLIPLRRNPFICEVLSLLHLMERKGSGFDKVEKDYSAFPPAFQPFASSDEASFSLTLPDLSYPYGVADEDNADIDLVYPSLPGEKPHTKEILSYCYFRRRSISEIASFLGIAVSSYLRSGVLGELVKKGLLCVEKEGNKDLYKANKAMVGIRGE